MVNVVVYWGILHIVQCKNSGISCNKFKSEISLVFPSLIESAVSLDNGKI